MSNKKRPNWRAEDEASGLPSATLRAILKIPGYPAYKVAAAKRELALRYAAKGFPPREEEDNR